MTMRAGLLDQRIKLQSNTPTENEFGEEEDDWSTYATVWARVEPLQGRERWAAQQVAAEVTHEVEIRWSGDTDDVKAEHRIVWGSRTLDIEGVVNAGRRGESIVLHCSEEVE